MSNADTILERTASTKVLTKGQLKNLERRGGLNVADFRGEGNDCVYVNVGNRKGASKSQVDTKCYAKYDCL